jgi:hypothetical protein
MVRLNVLITVCIFWFLQVSGQHKSIFGFGGEGRYPVVSGINSPFKGIDLNYGGIGKKEMNDRLNLEVHIYLPEKIVSANESINYGAFSIDIRYHRAISGTFNDSSDCFYLIGGVGYNSFSTQFKSSSNGIIIAGNELSIGLFGGVGAGIEMPIENRLKLFCEASGWINIATPPFRNFYGTLSVGIRYAL